MEGKRKENKIKEKKREGMKKTKKRNSLFLLRVAFLLKGKQKNSLSCVLQQGYNFNHFS
jgi:hypothetical protein